MVPTPHFITASTKNLRNLRNVAPLSGVWQLCTSNRTNLGNDVIDILEYQKYATMLPNVFSHEFYELSAFTIIKKKLLFIITTTSRKNVIFDLILSVLPEQLQADVNFGIFISFLPEVAGKFLC